MFNIIDASFTRYYEKTVLRRENADDVVQGLRRRVEASQSLLGDAKAQFDAVPEVLCKRCFVTKKKREFLTQVLEGM